MSAKPKILFISYSGPLPATDGKRQRTLALLRALEEAYEVDFLILDNVKEFDLAVSEYRADHVRFLLFQSGPPGLVARIKKRIGFRFIEDKKASGYIRQLAQTNDYLFLFARYVEPVMQLGKDKPVIGDIDDDFIELLNTRILNEPNWKRRWRLRQIFWMNIPSYITALKRVDLSLYSKEEHRHKKGFVLPNLPFQLLFAAPVSFRSCMMPAFLFVGKLTYEPNIKGVQWLLTEVWPLILKQLPEARLTLVSNTDVQDSELLKSIHKNAAIELKVNVKDLAEVYQRHALVLAPVFEGGGSSIKVVESLFMGRPVVTTSFGARGFDDAAKEGLISRCDTPEQFSKEAIRCLIPQAGLEEKQGHTFAWAQARYSFTNWKKNMLQAITDHLEGR